MFSAALVTGESAEAIQDRGPARMLSTLSAKLAADHGALAPQSIPFSISTWYLTSVVPVPSRAESPPATLKVPSPVAGTPSLVGGALGAAGMSPPGFTGAV